MRRDVASIRDEQSFQFVTSKLCRRHALHVAMQLFHSMSEKPWIFIIIVRYSGSSWTFSHSFAGYGHVCFMSQI
jgi:hypothetical protein